MPLKYLFHMSLESEIFPDKPVRPWAKFMNGLMQKSFH